jgi:Secretion system C-terminal sorting domain
MGQTVCAQSPIVSVLTSNTSVPTNPDNNINGAGYIFSVWTGTANFNIKYASDPAADITQVTNFSTSSFSNIQIVSFPSAIAVVNRVANATLTDTRNFITSWNRISTAPLGGATSGNFDCVAPKVISMETALLSNNINSGYDNVFENSPSQPHYNNIERLDYIIPTGANPISNLDQMGFAVFDRGIGDSFKIAAITSIDALNNPTGYGNLLTVIPGNYSAAGLLGSGFDYTIFVSDPLVSAGDHRPSTRSNQNIRGVFISLTDLGIVSNQVIYGYSLFGQDVDPTLGHVLTNPSSFPNNTSSPAVLDLVNVVGFFKTSSALLPVKLTSFTVAPSGNQMTIAWKTETEQNIRNFAVEKSNNFINWETIRMIMPANTVNGAAYKIADNNISNGRYYYRIKTIDNDGSFEYSKVVMAEMKSIQSVKAVANGGKIIVHSNTPFASVELFDISGRKISSINQTLSNSDIEIPVNHLQHGIYLLTLTTYKGVRKLLTVSL